MAFHTLRYPFPSGSVARVRLRIFVMFSGSNTGRPETMNASSAVMGYSWRNKITSPSHLSMMVMRRHLICSGVNPCWRTSSRSSTL
uniref:Putative terminase large subunit n=1 Tax=uncultured marine virus TaxID=186617 RepID=A0A0F7L076_9VIRU|nr:putative terminase large subunit [uncultured marine virus]